MRLPPLPLSSHPSAWGGRPAAGRWEALSPSSPDPSPSPPDDTSCRFCGAYAKGRQEAFHLDGDHANDAPANLVRACSLCHLTQHLDLASAERAASLIWLPEMPQQAIFAITRSAHLALLIAGEDPTLGTPPRQDTPAIVAAWRALSALRAREAACARRLRTTDPATLGGALLGLTARAYGDRATLLQGVRLLPLGRLVREDKDIYPELLRAWAAAPVAQAHLPGRQGISRRPR
ncbi:HNH endonuclease signature motif containing protein [Roseomonas mucosa]|uniref:HNH endonuclease signature motif containing protein n=1 Tax=Roseomonas mucosa TaxID=207340 RepID=UPI00384F1A30